MRIPIAIPPSRKQPVSRLLTVEEYKPVEAIQQQAEEIAKQPVTPPLPSTFEMAKNLTKSALTAARSVLQGQPLKESDNEAQRRLEICKRCEFFRQVDQRCSRWGCYMAVKTYLKSSKCPLAVPRW